MPTVTIAIPEDLKKEMEGFPDINWSAVARDAIVRRIELLQKFKEFAKNNELTDEDALRLGREVNKKLTTRYNKDRR